MEKDFFSFYFTIPERSTYSEDVRSIEFIRSLGLKYQGRRSTVKLDSPKIYEFIEKARSSILNDKAEFQGPQVIFQELSEDDSFRAEWYLLKPIVELDISVDENRIETTKAYKIPQNVNIADGYPFRIYQYVSKKFKETCEKHYLTGLDFIWVKDIGKYESQQWFIPIASNPVGRGVDHPWFDPEVTSNEWYLNPSEDPIFRKGNWEFEFNQIKKNVHIDNIIYKELIGLYSLSHDEPFDFRFYSYPRFLRKYLPDTDFAFTWRYDDSESADGDIEKERLLYLNRRARDALVQNKVITVNDVVPVMILDDLPEGCQLLDGMAPYPEPLLTPVQISEKRKLLAEDWEKHQTIVKPIKAISIKEALKYLRKAKKDYPNDFSKGLSKTQQEKLPANLPTNWIQVLSVSNGCKLNEECALTPSDKIPDLYETYYVQFVQDIFPDYPFDCPHIPIGHNIYGDWYSLEDKGSDAEDSRVFQVSHEDFSIVSEWATIPLFIVDMLTGFS